MTAGAWCLIAAPTFESAGSTGSPVSMSRKTALATRIANVRFAGARSGGGRVIGVKGARRDSSLSLEASNCTRKSFCLDPKEPLAKFIERGEFSLCSRGRSGRRSGRRGPELRDAEYLIDRERHHAEHEVAFDLDRAAHAHGPCAEFILQSGVDAFGQGAKIKNDVVRIGHMDEFHALDFFGPFGLGFVPGAKVAIDDRRMAERLAVVMDGGGVVGRIH